MRLPSLLILLVVAIVAYANPIFKERAATPVYGQTNAQALQRGLALPRPRSIPYRCKYRPSFETGPS
jgi:hypothetical protein